MTRVTLAVAILPAVLAMAGCFDVHSVDGPWVIDDFEDGDLKPADPRFGPWFCYTFSPPNQYCHLGLDAGDQSRGSLALDFALVDPSQDVGQQFGGVGVQTGTAAAPRNLSRFSEMVFTSKLVSAATLPSSAWASAQLGCSTAQVDDGTNPYVLLTFALTADWQPEPLTLSIADFVEPFFMTRHIVGGPAACLQRVDSIQFQFQPELSDGQSATARLNVDGIYFQ